MAHKFPLVAAHHVSKFQTNLMNSSFKKCQNVPKLALIGLISLIKNFLGKNVHVTFEPLWWPNFLRNFRNFDIAVFEKAHSARTHAQD